MSKSKNAMIHDTAIREARLYSSWRLVMVLTGLMPAVKPLDGSGGGSDATRNRDNRQITSISLLHTITYVRYNKYSSPYDFSHSHLVSPVIDS